MKRVVVTGYGAVCSLGENGQEIWEAILSKKLGYEKFDYADKSIRAKFFGFMKEKKDRYKGLSKSLLRCVPPFGKDALIATREALEMAFGPNPDLDQFVSPFERGVIFGTGWGGVDSSFKHQQDYLQYGQMSSFGSLMAMNNTATAAISMNWNLRGYQNSPVAACATGTVAIGDAAQVIRSGRAKLMIAGGGESLKEQVSVWSIDILGALSQEAEDPKRASCPFDKKRNGFVLSEGCAVLCLEEYESAKSRGARILGEITAYANFTDATDLIAPAVDLKAKVAAMKACLSEAGKQPADIHYINAHGTSTGLNDANETAAIKVAFGAAAYSVPISSTKSYTGHLIGGAGSLESIICLKVMETGIIPATANLELPDEDCDLNYVPNDHLYDQHVTTTMNLSFGFGGANAVLVFEKCE